MALKIRLARGGAKKRPYYRIVVAEASSPRDGRFVERIGSYNPMVPKDHPERLTLDGERAKYWMSKGAKPTLRVEKMLAGLDLVPSPVLRDQPKKSAPGKKRLEREAAAKEAQEAPAAESAPVAQDAPAPENASVAQEADAAPVAPAGENAPAEDTPEAKADESADATEDAPADESAEAKADDADAAPEPAESTDDAPEAKADEAKDDS